MELQGKTKLNEAISKELKPFGISEAVLSDEYAYDFASETVSFKIFENGMEDKFFTDFIRERFDYECPFPFVLSILHEIGHHKANDEIEGAIYDFCIAEKERIATAIESCISWDDVQFYEYQYFNLPDEIMATQWAVNYAKKHPKKIKVMWENMKKALYKFYEENGIFDELEESEEKQND